MFRHLGVSLERFTDLWAGMWNWSPGPLQQAKKGIQASLADKLAATLVFINIFVSRNTTLRVTSFEWAKPVATELLVIRMSRANWLLTGL